MLSDGSGGGKGGAPPRGRGRVRLQPNPLPVDESEREEGEESEGEESEGEESEGEESEQGSESAEDSHGEPAPIPNGWVQVEDFDSPFQHFLIWTRLSLRAEEPAAWHHMIVVNKLKSVTKEGFTHNAHLFGDSPRNKCNMELSQYEYLMSNHYAIKCVCE